MDCTLDRCRWLMAAHEDRYLFYYFFNLFIVSIFTATNKHGLITDLLPLPSPGPSLITCPPGMLHLLL